jgi:PadR family transcriptional regulator PadR
MRSTYSQREVAKIFVRQQPGEPLWGYALMKKAGIHSGTLYPILTRWVAEGWLVDWWELAAENRPARHYYEPTEEGRKQLAAFKKS